MRKNLKLVLMLALIAAMFGACSKDKTDTTMERIPANADVAIVLDLKKMVESAGGKIDGDEVALPEYLTEINDFDVKSYCSSGLKLDCVGGWADADNEACFEVFAVKDADRLKEFLAGKGYKPTMAAGGYEFYGRDGDYDDSLLPRCAVGDGWAYFIEHEATDGEVAKIIDSAASEPLSKTAQGQYASEGDAASLVMSSRIVRRLMPPLAPMMFSSATISMNFDIRKDEIVGHSAMFDSEGKRLSPDSFGFKFDSSATVSTDALEYLAPSEALVFAAALKDVDWDSVVNSVGAQAGMNATQRIMLGMIKDYLKKIDGTVAVGIGFDGTMADLENASGRGKTIDYLPLTIVVQTAPGVPKGLLGDLEAVLSTFGVRASMSGDSFSAHLPGQGGMIYGKAEKRTLILSTRQIESYDNNPAKKLLKGGIFGLSVCLPADYPLIREIGVDDNLEFSAVADAKNAESTFCLKVSGPGDAGVLERLIKLAAQYEKAQNVFEAERLWSPVRHRRGHYHRRHVH